MTANIEYTPPDVLREAQNAGLQQMIERAMRVEFYRQRLASHGIDSATLTVDDLPRLPCTHKEDLRSHYPYGLWACRREEVVEIHASSGTTGKPTVVGYTAADLRTWKLAMARTLTAVGVTPDDVVQNAYGYGCAVGELEKAKGLRVVVMADAGTSFCTGIDLHALATGEIRIEWFRLWEDTLRRLEMLEAITIAKLHGYVLGGGLQIALACDLRVATDTSKHRLPAVLEALIPGSGTWRLPRFIGLGRAQDGADWRTDGRAGSAAYRVAGLGRAGE